MKNKTTNRKTLTSDTQIITLFRTTSFVNVTPPANAKREVQYISYIWLYPCRVCCECIANMCALCVSVRVSPQRATMDKQQHNRKFIINRNPNQLDVSRIKGKDKECARGHSTHFRSAAIRLNRSIVINLYIYIYV